MPKKNIMFFVDGAHGAHFGLDDEHLPACPAKFCDAAVVSCHKTLPRAYPNGGNPDKQRYFGGRA